MRQRFYLFRKNTRIFFLEDTLTNKQESLRTRDRHEAEQILNAKRQSVEQPHLNIAIAKAHLAAIDPNFTARTWQLMMDEFLKRSGRESTRRRRQRAMKSKPFDLIRKKKLFETTADDLRAVMSAGGVFTNHFLRCMHNLASGLGWLPWPIIAPRMWPKPKCTPKRGITEEEHERILLHEHNVEKKAFYELLWETGASQSDAARLKAQDMDWQERTLSYQRMKTGEWCHLKIGDRLERLLRRLPSEGHLFPHIRSIPDNWRSAEFRRRCRLLNIEGVTLHSYRYAFAERCKRLGLSERHARAALGHASKAVHRAYSKRAEVVCPSLEEYEKKIIPLPKVV